MKIIIHANKLTYCKHRKKHYTLVYDQRFYGGEGVVDGDGGSSERCKGG